jgi:hypothetical protein
MIKWRKVCERNLLYEANILYTCGRPAFRQPDDGVKAFAGCCV